VRRLRYSLLLSFDILHITPLLQHIITLFVCRPLIFRLIIPFAFSLIARRQRRHIITLLLYDFPQYVANTPHISSWLPGSSSSSLLLLILPPSSLPSCLLPLFSALSLPACLSLFTRELWREQRGAESDVFILLMLSFHYVSSRFPADAAFHYCHYC